MTITSRAQWGGDPLPNSIGHMKLPAEVTYIHHSAGTPTSDEASDMRAIERFHIQSRGYQAIGYSFVVFPSGNVYEGRGWGRVGAHTEGHNSEGHGICLAGNFETQQPTQKALEATSVLLATGIQLGAIRPGAALLGHRDTKPTACPGKNLYALLPSIQPKEIPMPEQFPVYPVYGRVVNLIPTPSGEGYYIITDRGEVVNFGDAKYLGAVSIKA